MRRESEVGGLFLNFFEKKAKRWTGAGGNRFGAPAKIDSIPIYVHSVSRYKKKGGKGRWCLIARALASEQNQRRHCVYFFQSPRRIEEKGKNSTAAIALESSPQRAWPLFSFFPFLQYLI